MAAAVPVRAPWEWWRSFRIIFLDQWLQPRVRRRAVRRASIYDWRMPSRSIGRVKSFHGNFGILVRAYVYIRMLGPEGLRAVAENAVLNANYLQAQAEGRVPRAPW